jgi:ribonucleoside-diphosphate reductase alpha chain
VFQGILTGQCTEIIEYSDATEYAVCNLASLSLPGCCAPNPRADNIQRLAVNPEDVQNHHEIQWLLGRMPSRRDFFTEDISVKRGLVRVTEREAPTAMMTMMTPRDVWTTYFAPLFDFDKLGRLTRSLVVNLNAVIDQNRYPTPETRFSNLRHRPIGIGVQGLADVFCKMKIAFDSEQARQLNQDIFETIYFSALDASCERAVADGPYATFKGSPLSTGQLHWEMTDQKPSFPMRFTVTEWDTLRQRIVRHGVRNSLMIAPMPTASTSQILNNNECFEPYTSNFYTRRTSVGEYLIYNKELFLDLRAMGMWTTDMRQELLWTRGSVKDMINIPEWIREVYRTVWEIPQKVLIDMSADRAPFICQSQSLNLFLSEPTYAKISSMHMYAWKKGLKTGCYYLRTKAASSAQKFTVEPPASNNCLTCSS